MCARGRNRTGDLPLTRRLLSLLSYPSKSRIARRSGVPSFRLSVGHGWRLGVGAFGVRAVNSPLSSRCLECPGERHRVRFATEEAPAIRAKRGAQHIGYPFRAGSPTVERIKGLAERVTRTFCQRCRAEARSLDERVRSVANESFSWLSFH